MVLPTRGMGSLSWGTANESYPNIYQSDLATALSIPSDKAGLWQQLEYYAPRVLEAALAPEGLGSMLAANFVFRLGRVSAWTGLRALPQAKWWNRGRAAKTLASLFGFGLEAPTFTLAGRGISRTLGNPKPADEIPLSQQILSSLLLLGSLRTFGSAFGGLANYYARGSGVLNQFSRAALPQAGMLTGIMGGHFLETVTGLKEDRGFTPFLMESLAMLAQFNIAGRLIPHGMGQPLRGIETQLEGNVGRATRAFPFRILWEEGLVAAPVTPGNNLGWGVFMTGGRGNGRNGGKGTIPPHPNQMALELPGSSRRSTPPPGRRTPPPRRFPDPQSQTEPDGRGLLPDMRPQFVMDELVDSTPRLSPDHPLVQHIRLRVAGLPHYNTRALYYALEPILRNEAKAQATTLDVWLGRVLKDANPNEVNAALDLLRYPASSSSWNALHDITWIQSHGLRGGIPRLGEIGQDLSAEAHQARTALLEFAPNYRSEVLGVVENLLHNPSILIQNQGLEMARHLKAIELTPILRKLAYEKGSLVSRGAQRVLLEIEDTSLAPHFRKTLATPRSDFKDRAFAAYGLGKLGFTEEAIPVLTELARSPNAGTRLEAAKGLLWLNAQGSIPSCRKLIKEMNGKDLIQLAQAALDGKHHSHGQFFLSQALQQRETVVVQQVIQLAVDYDLQGLRSEIRALESNPYPETVRAAQRGQILLAARRGDKDFLLEFIQEKFEPQAGDSPDISRLRERTHRDLKLLAAEFLASIPLTGGERSTVVDQVRTLSERNQAELNLKVAALLARYYADRPSLLSLQYLLRFPDPRIRNRAARDLTEIIPLWDQGIRKKGSQIRRELTDMKIAPSPKKV